MVAENLAVDHCRRLDTRDGPVQEQQCAGFDGKAYEEQDTVIHLPDVMHEGRQSHQGNKVYTYFTPHKQRMKQILLRNLTNHTMWGECVIKGTTMGK